MEDRHIASIDIGSSKIALMVAHVDGDDIQVVYHKSLASKGVNCGGVINSTRAGEVISKLIKDAEQSISAKITQVIVGTPRYKIVECDASAQINRTDPSTGITEEEFLSLKDMATTDCPVGDPDKESVYGCVHQSFSTDEDIQMYDEDEIVGMMSKTFCGNYKLYIGKKTLLDNIDRIFNDLNILAIRRFSPSVLGDVILSRDEKDSGVALIDMGANVTSVSVYTGGVLRHHASIPFGGHSITNDIHIESGFSEKLSENIKLAYGCCTPERLAHLSDKIIRVTYPESGNYRDIKVESLAQIISAREKEIIDAMLWEIESSGLADELRSGIVLTGGAAEMCNVNHLAGALSGYSVRIGYPRCNYDCQGYPSARSAAAATCVGLIISVKSNKNINCTGDVIIPLTEGGDPETGTIFGPVPNKNEGKPKDNGSGNSVSPEKENPKENEDNTPQKPKQPITWGIRLGRKIKKVINNVDEEVGKLFDEEEEQDGAQLQ